MNNSNSMQESSLSLEDIEEQKQNQPRTEQYVTNLDSQFTRSYKRGQRESKIKSFRIILGSLILLFSLIVLSMGFYISRLSTKNERTSAELYKQTRQLVEVKATLKRLRSERESLIQWKLPNLLPLEYDKLYSFTGKYLRNIIFAVTKGWGESATEYRVVIQNNTQVAILPEVKILFFGDRGIQIGEAKVIPYGSATYGETVAPGEIRSYSGSIKLFPQDNPYYFLTIVG